MAETITVIRIAGFTLAVADPQRSSDFYCEGLGFQRERHDADSVTLSLGGVHVVLRVADGAASGAPRRADSPDFQHFAIRVRDMGAAHAQVSAFQPDPISRGGPQRLPPADGSVTAWKFRDPDGHPLELLQPAGSGGDAGAALFVTIDHTAVACADPAASRAFYEGLGLRAGAGTHNQGPAQDRLDGLEGADLDIGTAYTPAQGPHIELLHYAKAAAGAPPHSRDEAAFIATHLAAAGGPWSRPLLMDPDGHLLSLHRLNEPAASGD